jgi:hypothetical protein
MSKGYSPALFWLNRVIDEFHNAGHKVPGKITGNKE